MQYLLMIYQNEAEYAKMEEKPGQSMSPEYQAFTQSIISSGNYKGRNPRAARRLLHDRGQESRRGNRDCRAHSQRPPGLDRGTSDLAVQMM
jgi:hypothetical protein